MKKRIFMFVLLFAMLFSALPSINISAQESTLDLSGIDPIAQLRTENGTTPGVSVLIKKGDHILYNKSFGYCYLYDMGTLLSSPIQATNETVYDLASVTKVLATTQAIMKLVDQGIIDVDQTVATYMPEFGINGKEIITVRDLLTHTSGLAQWKPTYLYVNTREGEKEFVNNLSIEGTRGSYAYSDFSFMALAFLVEKVSGQPLESYLETNFYAPLGMTDTGFNPKQRGIDPNRIAATSWGNPFEWRMSNQRDYNVGYDTSADQEAFDAYTGWREYTLVGEVNDGNAGMANEGVAGHAGLFSTTLDISKIGDMMLNGGSLNGVHFYSPSVLEMFTTADPNRAGRGLGWRVGPSGQTSGFIGNLASPQTFAHDGFTGTQVIFDPVYDLQIIILTNKQNNGPYNDNGSYYSTYALSRDISLHAYGKIIEDINSVDRTLINDLIQEIEALDVTLYTETSVNDLMNQLTLTKQTLENPTLIQLELNQEYENLKLMFDALVEKEVVNKELLESKLQESQAIDTTLYTEESVSVLTQAIDEATIVLENVDATQAEVDQSVTNLQNVIEALVEKPTTPEVDKSKLETLITELDSFDYAPYTEESAKTLKELLVSAKELLSKSDVTQQEIDNIINSINNAKDALVTKEDLVVIEDYRLTDEKTKITAFIPSGSFENIVSMVVKEVTRTIEGRETLAYDITFVDSVTNQVVQPKQELTLSIPTKNLKTEGLQVLHEVKANTYESIKFSLKDSKVEFKSDQFSVYVLSAVKEAPAKDTLPDTGQSSVLIYNVLGVLVISAGLFLVLRKKENN